MTREEAINVLKTDSCYECSWGCDSPGSCHCGGCDLAEATRIAIESLEVFEWIPVTERLPEDLKPVNITYINEDPAPYYEHIKGIPFTATAIYYRGGWYWWSCTCVDVLAEYGHSYSDSMDEGIEVKAWKPLPRPWKGEER